MPDDSGRFASAEPSAGGGFGWQTRAWFVVKHLGIVHYGMDFIKDNVAALGIFVAEKPSDPEVAPEPLPLDHPAAMELERLGHGPYGGVSDLVAQLVVHNDVAGEGYLCVRYEVDGVPVAPPPPAVPDVFGEVTSDQTGEPPDGYAEVWEVLTPQTRKRREKDPKMEPVQAIRIWNPDPERPEFPDSSLRSVLTECEQLLLIQQHISGVLKSRLHAGLMVIPEELDPAPPGPPGEGDDTMSPLMRDMFNVFSSPISDQSAAAAIMPYLLFGKADLLGEVRHMAIDREFDTLILDMAEQIKIAVAGGMDLPAERLLGMGGNNHWNVWFIDESTYVQHLRPDVEQVLSGLTNSWLRPAWRAAGLDPDRYVVVVDPTPLTMMSSDGMPGGGSADEVARRVTAAAVLVRAGFDPESSLVAVGLPDIPHTGMLPASLADPAEGDVLTAAGVRLDGAALTAIDTRVLAALFTLADDEAERQAEEAETRLVEAMTLAGLTADTPNLAQALVDAGVAPETVVPDGAFDSIVEPAAQILHDGLADAAAAVAAMTGVPVEPGSEMAANVAGAVAGLAVALTSWLRSRWFSPTPGNDAGAARLARGDSTFAEVPAGLLLSTMTTAGGGVGATPGSIGVANGATVEGWMELGGLVTVAWTWVYGTYPRETFRPHKRLDGVVFDDFESDALYNVSNRWPHNSYWYPGDHWFCACRSSRTLALTEEVVT